jgi:hypothetical protein
MLAVLLAGCVSTSTERPARVVGYYAMPPTWVNMSLELELKSDGSYILSKAIMSDILIEEIGGGIYRTREAGTWSFDGELIQLEPLERTGDHAEKPIIDPETELRWQVERRGLKRDVVITNGSYPLKKTKKSDYFDKV